MLIPCQSELLETAVRMLLLNAVHILLYLLIRVTSPLFIRAVCLTSSDAQRGYKIGTLPFSSSNVNERVKGMCKDHAFLTFIISEFSRNINKTLIVVTISENC